MSTSANTNVSRRDMIKTSAGLAAASALAGLAVPLVHAGEDNTIRLQSLGNHPRAGQQHLVGHFTDKQARRRRWQIEKCRAMQDTSQGFGKLSISNGLWGNQIHRPGQLAVFEQMNHRRQGII